MDNKNIEALQWFVDFANLDLENIKPGDRAKLLVEAEEYQEYLWPVKELREYQWPSPLSKEHLGRLAWGLEVPPKESPEYWTAVLQAHEAVRAFFLQFLIPTVHPSPEVSVSSSDKSFPAIQIRGFDRILWWVGKGYKFSYKVKILPVAESQKDYLWLKIIMLLDGLPQHAIRVCPGCKKFFFNPTNREKRFCGEKCMRRISTVEYREKHNKKYKDYQNVLMKDRYREMMGHKRLKTKARKRKED
jgi:hypothetical protein